jgi:hypothetical protein
MKLMLMTLILLLVGGCALTRTTDFASIVDPDAIPARKPTVILVGIQSSELSMVMAGERAFKDVFPRQHSRVLGFTDLFPPTRTYTDEELSRRVQDNQVDTILVVELSNVQFTRVYIPPTYRTYFSGNIATTHQIGGFSVRQPNVFFRMRMYSLDTGKSVWRAEGRLSGNSFANVQDLMQQLARTARNDLIQKRLIER